MTEIENENVRTLNLSGTRTKVPNLIQASVGFPFVLPRNDRDKQTAEKQASRSLAVRLFPIQPATVLHDVASCGDGL